MSTIKSFYVFVSCREKFDMVEISKSEGMMMVTFTPRFHRFSLSNTLPP